MKNKGFTLIELAIVLVVLGLLLGLGVSLIGPLTKQAKYRESREKLNANVEAIIGYAIAHGRLPNATEVAKVVPYARDSTGKPFLYIYDENLTTTDSICTQTTTNITVERPDGSSVTDVAFIMVGSGVNYNIQTGLIAGSADIEKNSLFTAKVTSNVTVKVYEQGTQDVDDFPNDLDRSEEYDDIARWVTIWELKTKLSCK
ncbi:putative Ig family protein [Thermodesulfatator indicus DSM 15286]|uniref:Ig family protein n=1 Tax=Thermodesulfatator indicus (strain DSM 15286 / JCM 11887 / CIR29812) TaxID=667014 RepID=F8A9R0_THEID|nr:prepilin-type N-terminal cleavage/methylation domain-containing protein [Thermodesulfatator indicus]AEH45743.1 putative Ig family protein [Thermodesulfatator indicus DSM 15286]